MRILIVEDSARLRASLVRGLTQEGHCVEAVESGVEGLRLASRNPFDVIVLDLMLPGLPGLDVLRALRAGSVSTPVLILTARDGTQDVVDGFDAGADDYLRKPFAFVELAARVRALVRRRHGATEDVVRVGDLEVDRASRRVRVDGSALDVTARDLRVLEYLALRSGAVVTREELEDHVYRTADLPESNAIDSAICAVRRKLELAGGRTARIRTVRGVGYVLEEQARDGSR